MPTTRKKNQAKQLLQDAQGDIELPKKYEELGVTRGFEAPDARNLTMTLLGLSGVGKSTFAMSIPGAIVLSFQDFGNKSVIGQRAHRVSVPDMETYAHLRDMLIEDKTKGVSPFSMVVLDTVDEAWKYAYRPQIIAKWNAAHSPVDFISEIPKGRGYGDVADLCERDLNSFAAAGYGWLATAHLTVKHDDESIRVVPALTNSTTQKLVMGSYARCYLSREIVKYATKRVRNKRTGEIETRKQALPQKEWQIKRVLQIETYDELEETKWRLPPIHEEIHLPLVGGWDAFVAAYKTAVAEAEKLDSEALADGPSSASS